MSRFCLGSLLVKFIIRRDRWFCDIVFDVVSKYHRTDWPRLGYVTINLTKLMDCHITMRWTRSEPKGFISRASLHLMSLRAKTTTNSAMNRYPSIASIIDRLLNQRPGSRLFGFPPVNVIKLK